MNLTWGSCDELTGQHNPTKVCLCNGATTPTNLVALIRSSVREEVEDAIKRLVLPHLHISGLPPTPRSSASQAESSASNLQLHFVGTFPDTFLTLNNIQDKSASLMVELRDTSGSRVEVGSESSAKMKIQLVALDGDFEVEDRDHWTHEEFNKHVLSPRKFKGPLLVGDCEISLSNGVGIIGNVSFTDNSSWMKNGHFRLGARVMKGLPPGVVVRAAVSKAFKVREGRIKSYQKSKNPTLEDKIWRLESIAKDGPICRRLAKEADVRILKDFLQMYHTNAKRLQEVVGVSEKKWAGMVETAKLCSLTNEHYQYYDETSGVGLLLDCVFNIVGITLGQNSLPYEVLNDSQKESADGLRKIAYEKRSELPTIKLPTNQVMVQPQPVWPSSVPCTNMQYIDPTTANQGNHPVEQVNIFSHGLLQNTFGYDDSYQVEALESDQWFDEVFNPLPPLQEETANNHEASTSDGVTSKLKAACYVTKAAILFMVSIQQESTAPRKKQKLQ